MTAPDRSSVEPVLIEKILEDANVKIASAISDTLGRSGRAILDALVPTANPWPALNEWTRVVVAAEDAASRCTW